MKKPYEFLEHTADVKFRAYGKSIEEAFGNAILACTAVLIEPSKIKSEKVKKISIKSDSRESLLYDLIQELVFLMDTEAFITAKIDRVGFNPETMEFTAKLEGDKVTDYETTGDIKSATYTEMEIHEKDGDCWVQAVLDI